LSFYSAGQLANEGTPGLAYDRAALQVVEHRIAGTTGIPYYHFLYPPVFLPLCQLLARLPFLWAELLFVGLTAILYLAGLWRIIGRGPWLFLLSTFPPAFYAAGLGQNSFLTAALFAGAGLLGDRRPVAAGMLLGAAGFKPHFLILTPVALAAGGRWRMLAGLVAGIAALVALTLALYGVETWQAYLPVARHAPDIFAASEISPAGLISPFAASRLLGAAPVLAWRVQAVAILAAAIIVAWIWRRCLGPGPRWAALAAATVLAAPVILFYDMLLLGVAVAWLWRDAAETGFRPWEKAAFAAVWIVAGLAMPLAELAHVPLGPLPALLLLVLAARRGLGLADIRT
jgi:hypothetical protein